MPTLRAIVILLQVVIFVPVFASAQDSTVFRLVDIKGGSEVTIGFASQIDDAGLFFTARHLLPGTTIGPYTGSVQLAATKDVRATIATIVALGSYNPSIGNLADDWVLFQVARGTAKDDENFLAAGDKSFVRMTPALLDSGKWNGLTVGAGMSVSSNNSRWAEQLQQLWDPNGYKNRPLFSQGCVTGDPLFLELGETYAAGDSGTPFLRPGDGINRVVGVSSRWAVPQEILGVLTALNIDNRDADLQKHLMALLSKLDARPLWETDAAGISAALHEFDYAAATVLLADSDAKLQDALLRLQAAAKTLEAASEMVSVAPAACILNFFVERGDQFDADAFIALRSSLSTYMRSMKSVCDLTVNLGESESDLIARAIGVIKGTVLEAFLNNWTNLPDEIQVVDLLALRAWATRKCADGGKQFLTIYLDEAIKNAIYNEPLSDPESKRRLAEDFTRALSYATATQTAGNQALPLTFSYAVNLPGGVSGQQIVLEANLEPSSSVFAWADPGDGTNLPVADLGAALPDDYLRPAVQNDIKAAMIMRALAQVVRGANIDGPIPDALEADAARLAGNAIRIDASRLGGNALTAEAQDTAHEVVTTWLSKQPAIFSTALPDQYALGSEATVGDYLDYLAAKNVAVLTQIPAIPKAIPEFLPELDLPSIPPLLLPPMQLMPQPQFTPQLQFTPQEF